MSRHLRVVLLLGSVAMLSVIALWLWRSLGSSFVEYAPVVMDGQQQLVVASNALTADHLDCIEMVLTAYDERYKRVAPTKLLITKQLASDRELLWNYTTKANDQEWLASHSKRGQ